MRNERLTGKEPLKGADGINVGDFWTWAYSNLLDNRNRSVFGEFVVAVALGLHQSGSRVDWDAVDLRYGDKLIEVKTSAYVQSWNPDSNSKIVFDIGAKFGWDAASNVMSDVRKRFADVYVFCLLNETNPERVNVLDLTQWDFYVVSRRTLDNNYPEQKSLTLSVLQSFATSVKFSYLKTEVDSIDCA